MPRISLQIEADSADEYLTILTRIVPLAVVARHKNDWAAPFHDVEPDEAEQPQPDIQSGTFGIKQDDEPAPVEVARYDGTTGEPVEEKKARKPRGPNKPKMAPVTEDAPEEVEHVGTVAVGIRKAEEEKPAVTERVPEGNGEVLTRTDLGDTIAGYVRKYGINFAQTDVSKMLQDMFGADVRKKSDVPDDQPSLRKAITTITQATIDNPYNRKVDVNG